MTKTDLDKSHREAIWPNGSRPTWFGPSLVTPLTNEGDD